jgi:hypothetical protein
LQIRIEGDLEGSIRSIYEGAKTKGNLSAEFKSNFLSLFPEADRAKSFQLYTRCLADSLTPRKAIVDPSSIPQLSAQIVPQRTPNEPPGVIGITFRGSKAVNVGYSQFRALSVSHLCRGEPAHVEFYTRVYGKYNPYDSNTGWMYINEAEVFYRWCHLFNVLKFDQNISCLIAAAIKIVYKVDFENESGDHFVRYLVANFAWNGQVPNLQINETSQSEWQVFADLQDKLKTNGSIGMFNIQNDSSVVRQGLAR